MTFGVYTLGCKVNSYESEVIISDLINKGLILKRFDEVCDIYLINTCTVTSTSDQKSRQIIRSAKRRNPEAIVVAMGCYIQTHLEEAKKFVDILIGTNERTRTYELIISYLETKSQINKVMDIMEVKSYEEMSLDHLTTHTRGFIKIEDGCENYCSYCAIPYARGKVRSRQPDNIINEIKKLVSEGVKEIIISGINTGCYGIDLDNTSLAKLIIRIMEETSLYRLRLSSIELMEVTDELLAVIKQYQKRIAQHLHIPLQAGSDSVLKRMKRKYLTNNYRELINKVRTLFPNIAITTDCLAGFVGETNEEFIEAYQFIEEMKFADMHIFPYSRRKNTEADKMSNHLDSKVINERTHLLLNLAKKMHNDYQEMFIGSKQELVVEKKKGNYYHGYTSNYLEVLFESENDISENTIKEVVLERIVDGIIYGKEI